MNSNSIVVDAIRTTRVYVYAVNHERIIEEQRRKTVINQESWEEWVSVGFVDWVWLYTHRDGRSTLEVSGGALRS